MPAPRIRSTAFVVGMAASLCAQEPSSPPPATAEMLLDRYRALPVDKRAQVVRNLERRLQRDGDATIQRIVARTRGRSAYPPPPKAIWFAPADYAPTATPRTLVTRDLPVHLAATKGMVAEAPATEPARGVVFDWHTGAIVLGPAPSDDQTFSDLVNGCVPGSDEATAQVQALLDTDPDQRRLAAYFGHLYADRVGNVFAGVTLFDAWNSGAQIEMPDTDVIAFARSVLGEPSWTAPLPANRQRNRLYEKVRTAFGSHREYRTLRIALAATFVAAEPPLDAPVRNLIPRCHWLWAHHADDPAAVAKHLSAAGDRTKLLREIDTAMAKDGSPGVRRQRDLSELADYLRRLAEREIARSSG